MVIPKSSLKSMVIEPNPLPVIHEGEFAERVVAMLTDKPNSKQNVQLIAGIMSRFYQLGFNEGLHEAADKLAYVIKHGVVKK